MHKKQLAGRFRPVCYLWSRTKEWGFDRNWIYNSEIIHSVADSICGEFVRKDAPILAPRDCSCWNCTITTNPAVAIFPDGRTPNSRLVRWEDGTQTRQGSMERPWLLFDEAGEPTYLLCASGKGTHPYSFEGETFIVVQK